MDIYRSAPSPSSAFRECKIRIEGRDARGRRLERMQAADLSETFDGRHLGAVDLHGKH